MAFLQDNRPSREPFLNAPPTVLWPIGFLLAIHLAAVFVQLTVYGGSPMQVVGASGAVSGLMAAGMRILYGRLYGGPGELAPIFSKPILGFSAVWIIANVVTGILRIGVSDDLTLIAWVAHLGGFFAGLVLIGPFRRRDGEAPYRSA